ncbi:cation diffusion facilitator transporter family protein [Collimonas fungivorans]|uniref:Cation diffusion facilitator transporter family protein n=1 Tax=Collimonas fungivorans TaxID=158899 RepID=A0A127PE53_9BURK|nr:cation diffusion facilitator family transporter [Collimonas fungivorans]AMO96090.1 cation diffusion facilitator transporter family protein [Collimonas fungivorans]
MAVPSGNSSRTIIYVALAGNLLVAVTKFVAAAWTGSSAMLSEGIHSLVDTGNEILLLYGMRRSAGGPDRDHPLGHGREIYFWSFVVALLIFTLGAGVSIYEGVTHVPQPQAIQDVHVNYAVLALSALFEGSSWWFTLRKFKQGRPGIGLLPAVRRSKDPPSFIVLLEDSAALVGLLIAFAGVYCSVTLKLPVLDGIASILIGLVLAATALILARETKGLLIGESAHQSTLDSILRIAGDVDGVVHAHHLVTVHLAPQQILAALSLEFTDEFRSPDIEACVIELEKRVLEKHPSVVALFIKPQTSHHVKQIEQRDQASIQ